MPAESPAIEVPATVQPDQDKPAEGMSEVAAVTSDRRSDDPVLTNNGTTEKQVTSQKYLGNIVSRPLIAGKLEEILMPLWF